MFNKLFSAFACASLLALGACSDDDEDFSLRTLSFEDAEGSSYWTSLIDNPQYMGKLLYGGEDYVWEDKGNTNIKSSGLVDAWGAKMYYNGGIAVSNYSLTDLTKADYTAQLAVPFAAPAGHNGSKNFCVAFIGSYGDVPSLSFSDGVARTLDHMYITNTSYTYNSLLNGDDYTPKATPEDWYSVKAVGYDAAGNKTDSTTCFLAQNGHIFNDWVCWDLTKLGNVVSVKFFVDGSITNDYGLATPSYFAFDDLAVRY